MIVSATIQFNNQICLCAEEIYNIVSNRFLALKTHGILTQKFIP